MNATLISASERSREIGVRRSIGASRSDVFFQFVIEAGLLALVGVVGGCALGLLFVAALAPVLGVLLDGWELRLIPWGPALAVVVPTVVSAAVSAYPAWRGAGLAPVVALRRG